MTMNALKNVYASPMKIIVCCLGFSMIFFFPLQMHSSESVQITDDAFFTLDNGINLRESGGKYVARVLTRVKGKGKNFGQRQRQRYCTLKTSFEQIQWVLNDLETGEIISKSGNAGESYFGASSSKLFVAAALLDKQDGTLSKEQLRLMVKMIVVSGNRAWKELQRQVGEDGTNDSGREAINAFVEQRGYTTTRGFQGWWKKKDGTKVHGNELNTMELSRFLFDTYHRNYKGAEVLWKIMHATTTGSKKIDKYTPKNVYIGGKTGTYHGPNESPETIKHKAIKAHNHAAVLNVNNKYYGISVLSNTGNDEDVAVLAGGLIREYLDAGGGGICQ
jgi:hypothetical protein